MRATILFCFLFLLTSYSSGSKDIITVLDDLLSSSNYDKRIRPNSNAHPVDVAIEAAVVDAYNFDEINHQVTISMILRHKWTDPRLQFSPEQVNGTKVVNLGSDQVNKLWIPDTFIKNERSVTKHDFSSPNEYTRVQSNGSINRSVKLTVTFGCILNLRWYPFDQNVCSLDFESYAFTMNDLRYSWGKDNKGKPKIWVSKEAYQSVRHEITAVRGSDFRMESPSGNYSRVGLELCFKRLSFRYFLDVYFPSTAIPILAFITLCVGPLHFRVLLSTICMGIMIVYAAILMTFTPKVDYKTALDFYVFNSSITVFNVVLINFFIYYLLKPKSAPSQMRMRQMNGSSSNEEGKGILSEEEGAEDAVGTSSTTPRFPNKTCELLYSFCEKSYFTVPLFFAFFNLIYWPVVLIGSSGIPEDFIPIETRI